MRRSLAAMSALLLLAEDLSSLNHGMTISGLLATTASTN